MGIFKTLLGIIKVILPFLKTAAEKSFKKLPKDQQDKLIQVSQLVEVVKQAKGKSTGEVFKLIEQYTGLNADVATGYLIEYLKQKGIEVKDINPFTLIWEDAEQRTEMGLKSLWSSISNVISSTVANIDWQALLMGIGEYVYQTYVKGKIKV